MISMKTRSGFEFDTHDMFFAMPWFGGRRFEVHLNIVPPHDKLWAKPLRYDSASSANVELFLGRLQVVASAYRRR